ncbi:MAG TPA: hypothetical protein VF796_20810 [Humisphaera sp.]
MNKKVALVGHCGPDSSYLRLAIQKAEPGVQILAADDDAELKNVLEQNVDLILFNRQLDYGFDDSEGVSVIRKLSRHFPRTRMMLVSNYPDAQQAALQAGAVPGFGKRDIGSAKVTQLIREALAHEPAEAPATK